MNPIPFKVNSSNTTYLAFSFKPKNNINQIQVNIDISGGFYNLFNDTFINITKLKTDDYFFFAETHQFNFIKLTLTMNNNNNTNTNPFSYIYSYELNRKEDYIYYQTNTNQPTSIIINENQIIVSVSQKISLYTSEYIFFQIRPSYYIDYIIINIDITDNLIDLGKSF